MILAYVPKATANVTANLYKGLVKVIVWKILWTTLGVLLLKMASEPIFNGVADYIMNIVMNLCIGLAMLFIPMATKSLINDGLEGAASALSAAPGLAVAGAAKGASMKLAKAGGQKAKGLFSFASRPANNLASRGKRWAKAKSNYDQRVGNRIKQGKTWYSELGLNEEQKIEKQKNMRRYYAIKSKYSKK